LVKFGDNVIVFEKSSLDNLKRSAGVKVNIKTSFGFLIGEIVIDADDTPEAYFKKIVEENIISDKSLISWKSACEDLVLSRKFDNGGVLFTIDLCVDSQNYDSTWHTIITHHFPLDDFPNENEKKSQSRRIVEFYKEIDIDIGKLGTFFSDLYK
jgi:hypothetical protein